MTEEDADSEELFEFLVVIEENVIVSREGTHLRIPHPDAEKGPSDIRDRHRPHFFNERDAELPVDDHEEASLTTLPGLDEVALGVTNPSPPIGDLRPYINEFPVFELRDFLALFPPSPLSFLLLSVGLDLPAVYALQEPLNGVA